MTLRYPLLPRPGRKSGINSANALLGNVLTSWPVGLIKTDTMPYKSEKIRICGSLYDRRQKLTPEDKDEIRRLYPEIQSQRKLAAMFGVSRRLITFIVAPDKDAENKRAQKERKRLGCYKPTKKQWAATMREHRHYKYELYKQGIIQTT